ncbi:unnamed protein product [Polarella glacialis]|uniref:Uncharacterized protein n=1 Tax=Polarella glacialis TaxID=89957 RepID=A0A813K7R4_POLGL|nr:unnamed protein product [Polarella glacialis]
MNYVQQQSLNQMTGISKSLRLLMLLLSFLDAFRAQNKLKTNNKTIQAIKTSYQASNQNIRNNTKCHKCSQQTTASYVVRQLRMDRSTRNKNSNSDSNSNNKFNSNTNDSCNSNNSKNNKNSKSSSNSNNRPNHDKNNQHHQQQQPRKQNKQIETQATKQSKRKQTHTQTNNQAS